MSRIRLVHWKPKRRCLESTSSPPRGYDVAYEPFDPNTLRGLAKDPPDAFVIDLTRLPSHGRDIGIYVRERKATRRVPIVFIGGAPDKVARAKERLPDAVYAAWEDAAAAIEDAIANPPEDPVVPASTLAGYSGTPLPKKLGISRARPSRSSTRRRTSSRPSARCRRASSCAAVSPARRTSSSCSRRGAAHLEAGAPEMRDAMPDGGRLWLAWPKKASGVVTDVSEPVVRESAWRPAWSTTRYAPSTRPGPGYYSPAGRRDEAAANAGGALTYYRDAAAPRRRVAETGYAVDAGVDCIDSDQTGPIGYRRNHTMELERVASQRG